MSTEQSAMQVCRICTKPFSDPRTISCLHSFCRVCLEEELAKGPGSTITCPTCQRRVPLTERGVAALPKNLYLAFQVEVAGYSAAMETTSGIKCSSCSVESNGPSKAFCCTCREFLCQFCWDYHKANRRIQGHNTIPVTKETARQQLPSLVKPPVPSCEEHGEALKFYCKVCDHPVCQVCITGPQDTGPQHTGPEHTGPQDTGPQDTGPQDTGSQDTSPQDTSPQDTGPQHTISNDTGPQDTGSQDTGPQHTSSNDMDHQHDRHSYTSVVSAAFEYRSELTGTLDSTNGIVARIASHLGASDEELVKVDSVRQSVISRVEADFDRLEEALCARRAAVLESVKLAMQVCGQPFREHKEVCLKKMEDIARSKEVLLHALEVYTDDELMALKRMLTLTQADVLHTSEYFLSSAPQYVPIIPTHSPTCGILEQMEQLGVLVVCPAHSSWNQVQTSPPVVHSPYQMVVQSRDSKGEKVASGGLGVRAELKPKMEDQPCIVGEVEDHKDGTYTITLTPLTTGHHQLCITIYGHHILNSPCYIHVAKNYTCWKSVEMTIAVEQPFFVALDNSGNIYVTSGGKFAIHVFEASGRAKLTVGEWGSGNGQFNNPRGIAVKGDVMYIADYSNNRVQKLTTGGTFLLAFGHKGSGVLCPLKGPLGICIDLEERVIVSDYGNHMVQLYSRSGVHLHTIDGNSNVSRFVCPCTVAVDPQGNIHVGAKPNAQNAPAITVFTPNGAHLRSYGALRSVTSIDVHGAGHSVLCEYGKTNGVQIFDPSGGKLGIVPTEGSVFAVAIDGHGGLYVTMHVANKVVKY